MECLADMSGNVAVVSIKMYIVGSQKDCLIETAHLSTQNKCSN